MQIDTIGPTPAGIHHLFESQVIKTPDTIAVTFEQTSLTYLELNCHANLLARKLLSLGVVTERCVGVCLERSLHSVIAMLAVMKAGGVYVPIDPRYPQARKLLMLKDTGASVVITQDSLAQNLKDASCEIVELDVGRELSPCGTVDNPAVLLQPENAAYIIYTSGSSGRPKGVVIEHRNILEMTETLRDLHVGPGKRFLQFASPSFGGAISEVFCTLLTGATLCIATQETLMPGPGLKALLIDRQITTLKITPSALSVMDATDFPALDTIMVAGEPCSKEIVAKWSDKIRLLNGYGMTECGPYGTVRQLKVGQSKILVGKPTPGTRVYILNAQRRKVPIGVKGEIYLSCKGTARGYLNSPELTSRVFMQDPFVQDPSVRMYKTGDLGRFLADGNIEVLGRADGQVKIRGHRIELSEIEQTLMASGVLTKALVVSKNDLRSGPQLVAYVVFTLQEAMDVEMLRRHVRSILPIYMVPSFIVPIQSLPLNSNGKVDLKALPDTSACSVARIVELPQNEIEKHVRDIWSEVLGVPCETIGVNDNFFEIGGHSLLAAMILNRIKEDEGLSLEVRNQIAFSTVFEHASVAELAKHIGTLQSALRFDSA